ncbi:hypothetical protein FRACYDRAFT_245672 [Fragilariopsis cylindrus CCMP1102]|uniref:Uncharacterized protein n=1 Tax=Fragilariopsis cylindrus CCMP1102 TaxID=635003 RepID=A0A1E7EZR6_9STRA|nr:hypothetical protein FRACYDRAFT_245672 [Fragilariopsis cylindrus CCMP1102]|eukprot:OEU11346.1 hypothetical protein FRACYDRAFT_245672 [Fragilariopsis cylindrus CCMP1102]
MVNDEGGGEDRNPNSNNPSVPVPDAAADDKKNDDAGTTTTNLLYRMTQKMDRTFYVTTSVKDFCPGGNQQNGRMDNLDTMMYVDDTNSEIGSAADYLGWPARATGYTAILELCQ